MTFEEDKIEYNKQNQISKEEMILEDRMEDFYRDFDFVKTISDVKRKRISWLKNKGYSEEDIYLGINEYNKRKSQEKEQNKQKNVPYIFNLFEASLWNPEKDNITFNDIIGLDNAKKILNDRFEKYYKYLSDMKQFKIEPASGIGLHGMPGVGKSDLMKALLNKCAHDLPEPKPILLYVSIAHLLTSRRVAKIIQKFFDKIKSIDNLIIICIDEIDMVMRGKDDTNSVLTRELTSIFLQQWNGSGNIFVVFTTNLLNDVADAFISRVGYENCVKCELPTPDERKLLIKKYMTFPLSEEHIKNLVNFTEGYAGRDIKKLAQPIFILYKENNPLTYDNIKDKMLEINNLKNQSLKEMMNKTRYKNLPNKFKEIELSQKQIELINKTGSILINSDIIQTNEELDKLFDTTDADLKAYMDEWDRLLKEKEIKL